MSVADSLAVWGIQRAPEVVELAADAGLPLNIAAALLEQESGGGYNVWGSDGVATGGAYVKGAQVTRQAYELYRNLRRAGQICNQGVGPVQLTSTGYQDQADQLGGCWDWRANVAVGFRTLAGLIRVHGTAAGIKAYNGSGPMADLYRDQMLAKAAAWATRLGAASTITPVAKPAPTPWHAAMEDDLMASIPIFLDGARSFQVAVGAEAGGGSAVASRGWITFGSTFGPTVFTRVAALGPDGQVLGRWEDVTVANNTNLAFELPDGTRAITAQGTADNAGTRPWVSYWGLR